MPAWHPHPDVLAVVFALGGGYAYAVRKIGPKKVHAVEYAVTRGQVAAFATGLATLFVASYWPMHDLAEGELYSVHMVQHMMLSLIAPPLLMIGTPDWLWRFVLGRGGIAVMRRISRPFIALVIFNVVVAITHIPSLVAVSTSSEMIHFLLHALVVSASVVMWTPVLNPLIELPKLNYPGRMFYLFLQSLVPTVPASFLTFGQTVLYKVYDVPPETFGISALSDQRLAGLIMKIGGGGLLWLVIAWYFFKWFSVEEKEKVDVLEWSKIDGPRSELVNR